MFAARYYGNRYYAGRYFPHVGADPFALDTVCPLAVPAYARVALAVPAVARAVLAVPAYARTPLEITPSGCRNED